MQVTIDGVPFVPACASASRVGIAITTHNRPDVLNRAIEQHIKHLPSGCWWWLSTTALNLSQ